MVLISRPNSIYVSGILSIEWKDALLVWSTRSLRSKMKGTARSHIYYKHINLYIKRPSEHLHESVLILVKAVFIKNKTNMEKRAPFILVGGGGNFLLNSAVTTRNPSMDTWQVMKKEDAKLACSWVRSLAGPESSADSATEAKYSVGGGTAGDGRSGSEGFLIGSRNLNIQY